MEVVIGEHHFKGIHDQWISTEKENPFTGLDEFLAEYFGKHILIFIAYDVKNHIEDLQTNHKNDIGFPLIHCIIPAKNYSFKGFKPGKKQVIIIYNFNLKLQKRTT